MTTIRPCKALLGISIGLAFVNLWPTSARADDIALCNQANVKPDDGIAACSRLLARPTLEADSILLNRARGWSAKGDLDSAIEDYTSAIQRNPRNTDALLNRGAVWYRKNEYDRAISDFNLILGGKRDHAVALVYRGVALSAKGEFDRAVSDFDQSIRLDTKNPAAYRFRAVAHYRRRDFDRSIDDFNMANKLAPTDATIYNDRAQVFVDTGKFDRAIADYNQAIRLDPNGWRAYSSRGEARRLKGDLNGALTDHDKALKLDSRSHDAYINRALVWKDKGELDKGIADLDEAILLSPSDARALGNRGEMKRLKNDLEGSRADLDNAIKIFQSSTVLYCRRADTWLAIGSLDRATDDYNQARVISPNALCAHAGRGLVQEKQGDLVAARLEFDKALKGPVEKDPDPVMGRQAQELASRRMAAIDAVLAAQKLVQPANLLPEPAVDLGTRVALVIGNSGYQHAGALPNPRQDAEAVAKSFRDIGFQKVILEYDLSRTKLLAALSLFEAIFYRALPSRL